MAKRQVTLKQIAEQAGCAVSIVSTVINGAQGNTKAGPELREKVMTIAQNLGYEVNYHAQGLRKQKASAIGLVLPPERQETIPNLHTQMIAGVSGMTRAKGNDLILIGPVAAERELQRGIRYVNQKRVDALIVPGLTYQPGFAELEEAGIPAVVAISRVVPNLPRVDIDYPPGIVGAAKHLVDLGHREILWLAPDISNIVDRGNVLGEALRDRSVELKQCRYPEKGRGEGDGREHAAQAFAEYLESNPMPTAVVAYNELNAAGIYAYCLEHGIHIPRDLSVIGIDDVFGNLTTPPMTVISLNFYEVGRRAAALAMELDGKAGKNRSEFIPTRLVLRQSTGPAKGWQ